MVFLDALHGVFQKITEGVFFKSKGPEPPLLNQNLRMRPGWWSFFLTNLSGKFECETYLRTTDVWDRSKSNAGENHGHLFRPKIEVKVPYKRSSSNSFSVPSIREG